MVANIDLAKKRSFLSGTESQCVIALATFSNLQQLMLEPTPNVQNVFYALQSFLNRAAYVAELIWAPKQSEFAETAEILRVELGLKETFLISSRTPTKKLEHMDEALERWSAQVPRGSIFFTDILAPEAATRGQGMNVAPLNTFCHFDLNTGKHYFENFQADLPALARDILQIRDMARKLLYRHPSA